MKRIGLLGIVVIGISLATASCCRAMPYQPPFIIAEHEITI